MSLNRSKTRICGGILAGGTADRCGNIAKGLIEIEPGLTIIEHIAAQMKKAGVGEIVLSVIDTLPYQNLGFEMVTDKNCQIGPIGGIEALLGFFSGSCDAVLILPCDLPNITAVEIKKLIDMFSTAGPKVVVPRTAPGHFHPLCAVVSGEMKKTVTEAIKAGERKIMNIWRQNDVRIIDFKNERTFYNINTRSDLVRWLETKGQLAQRTR